MGDLFRETAHSGSIRNRARKRLPDHWVIDWRRFYKFPDGTPDDELGYGPEDDLGYDPAPTGVNMAARIDPLFDMRLDRATNFPHGDLPEDRRSITVRNLLRGFALGLPTGEEVAAAMGERPLTQEEVSSGPHQGLLSDPVFKGKTPLWYYILKEAERGGGSRLGPVGGRIVAETLVGLIENSSHSILRGPKWYPRHTRRGTPGTELARFRTVDLLDFAGVVNPVGGP